jgi:hypothetical protein
VSTFTNNKGDFNKILKEVLLKPPDRNLKEPPGVMISIKY